MEGHIPVMLPEVLGALQPADGEIYIDGTYGGGGYARAILAAATAASSGLIATRRRWRVPGMRPTPIQT